MEKNWPEMYIHTQRRKFLGVFQVLHTFFLLSMLSVFSGVRKFWKAQYEKQPRSNGLDIVHNVNASKGPHMKRNVRWDNGVWRELGSAVLVGRKTGTDNRA